MNLFNVSFEKWSNSDVDCGDTDKRGFIDTDMSLSDALQDFDYIGCELSANCYPLDITQITSVTAYATNDGTREYYEQGITENRTLFFPASLTNASKKRILKYLGLEVN